MSGTRHTRDPKKSGDHKGGLPDGLKSEAQASPRDPEAVRLLQREVTEAFESPILGGALSGRSLAEALAASTPLQSANLDDIVTADDTSDRALSGFSEPDSNATSGQPAPLDPLGDSHGDDLLGQGMLSLWMASVSDAGAGQSDSSMLDEEDTPLV